MPTPRLERFGKYELIERIAKGGMGETYLAELQAVAGVTKRVVIKKMLPQVAEDAALVEAFVQEARITAGLSHGNIAQVFDFGEIDGEYFLAMEYVRGRSLLDVLGGLPRAGYPNLPYPVTAYVVIELLKALHYAHTRTDPDGRPLNIVHRDISHDNVLISYEGDVKLVDFGVAKSAAKGRAETEPGLVKGKYRYLSPEQAQAKPLDARSDLFSVGIVLYELLAGASPFAGRGQRVMTQIVSGEISPLRVRAPDVPEALVDVTMRALERDKELRPGSAREMQEALSRWLFTRTPDFSGDVLRELMGELFAEELARAGTPFVQKARATKVLVALKSQSSLAPLDVTPPAPREEEGAEASPRTRTLRRPGLRGGRGALALLGLAAVVGGAIGLAVELSPPAEGEAPALEPPLPPRPTAAEKPEPSPPPPDAQMRECEEQLDRVVKAMDALEANDRAAARAALDFSPAPCAKDAHQRTQARLKAELAAPRLGLAPSVAAAPPGAAQTPRAGGDQLLELARLAYKTRDHHNARGYIEACLKLDPTHAECHKLLGATFGMLGEGDRGAREYELFLKFAPDHPQARQVRALLEAYWNHRP